MSWACLHNYSHYSLLHSSSTPIRIAERANQLKLPAIALTDEGRITGAVAFIDALKKTCECGHHKNSHSDTRCYGNNKTCKCTCPAKDVGGKSVKPILGTELFIRNNDKKTSKLILISKNLDGWKKLISITSEANKKENIIRDDTPTLLLEDLEKFLGDGNLIGISGYAGSQISDLLFENPNKIYFADDYNKCRKYSSLEKFNDAVNLAGKLHELFGKDNFYLETQNFNKDTEIFSTVISNAVRAISKKTGIKCFANSSCNYAFPEDFDDQRLLVCSDLDSSYNDVDKKFYIEDNAWLKKFFDSRKYYIPSSEEMIECNPEEELKISLEIADKCETYNILNKPILPYFECPDGKNPDQHLKDLCVRGWKEKITNIVSSEKLGLYKEQIKTELEVIQNAGLSSYFLIVEDYCRAARENGQLLGNGRGSAAGSLISYLVNITKTDPVKYGLMFERFYNAGRNTADRVSLPDIDTDFEDRDEAIAYIKNKYGYEKVGQMISFSRIQGKGSLKEVFRIKYPDIPITEINRITESLPDESEINDKLQEMKELGEEPSIIMWALESNSKKLKEFCYLDDNNRLQGEYSAAFRQAIRLEGTKKSQSKHPSGIVIANTNLANIVPMVYDKSSKTTVAGLEMNDLENVGLCKFDILEIRTLRKLHTVAKLLEFGDID